MDIYILYVPEVLANFLKWVYYENWTRLSRHIVQQGLKWVGHSSDKINLQKNIFYLVSIELFLQSKIFVLVCFFNLKQFFVTPDFVLNKKVWLSDMVYRMKITKQIITFITKRPKNSLSQFRRSQPVEIFQGQI